MAQKLRTQIIDYSDQPTDLIVYTDNPTAQQITDWIDALAAAIIGVIVQAVQVDETTVHTGSTTPPTDGFAQNSTRWKINYTDTVTSDRYSLYIPTADASLLNQLNSDFLNLADPDIAAVISVFEDVVRSENGNLVNVTNVELVG